MILQKIKKLLIVNFCLLIGTAFAAGTDPREVADWGEYPEIIRLLAETNGPATACTAQYVEQNAIATAAHCMIEPGTQSFARTARFTTSDGRNCTATLVATDNLRTYDFAKEKQQDDWTLLQVDSPDCFNPRFLRIKQGGATLGSIDNIGFGYLAVLTNYELHLLRKKMQYIVNQNSEFIPMPADEAILKGRAALQSGNLIAQFIYSLKQDDEGGPSVKNPFNDTMTLKIHKNCDVTETQYANQARLFRTTCVAYGGNSGSAYVQSGALAGVAITGNAQSHEFDFGNKITSTGNSLPLKN